MEPEIPPTVPGARQLRVDSDSSPLPATAKAHPDNLLWLVFGDSGLRAGTSIALFAILMYFFALFSGTLLSTAVEGWLHKQVVSGSATGMILGELPWVAALVVSGAIVARLQRRHLLDFNLRDRHPLIHFVVGSVAGFMALSALVGVMAWGGWLHFGPLSLHGEAIAKYGVLWSIGFLFVGLTEEGMFRCIFQSILTRGVNFWWALGIEASICTYLLLRGKGHGIWGIYFFALLGLFPCLWLFVNKTRRSGFWMAAWVTSTTFGFVHTFNNGENWIGIFAAAAIGFVFCLSIYVTGSAWWAIGCHSAWDWAETYFYGTPDSGFVAKGHYLTTAVTGNVLFSGGADGPEGSLLVLPIILALMAALLALYVRRRGMPHISSARVATPPSRA